MRISKVILILLAVPFILLAAIMVISQIVPSKPPPDFLITKNPVDLSQIKFISQFRSCHGHKSMSQGAKESPSSMAHYVYLKSNLPDTVKIFAPFDGYVNHTFVEGFVDNEDSFALIPKSSRFPWWPFNQYRIHVSHARTLPQYSGTAKIKAGDLIGYANVPDGYDGQSLVAFDFRMGVVALPPEFKDNNGEPLKNMDSIFNYMTPEVFAEYQSAIPGLENPQDFIIPAEWRNSHLCKYRDGGPYFESSLDDYINEKYRGAVFIGVGNDPIGIREILKCFGKTINPDCNTR